MENFKLFGSSYLNEYIENKLNKILDEIEALSDDTIFELEGEKEEYIERTAKKHTINTVDMKWTKQEGAEAEPFQQKVDNVAIAKKTFFRYKFPLSGNDELLGLNTRKSYSPQFNLMASVQKAPKMLTFTIDTGYFNLPLPDKLQKEINTAAIQRRDYIRQYIDDMNAEIVELNKSLKQRIRSMYETKLRQAEIRKETKDTSNPF